MRKPIFYTIIFLIALGLVIGVNINKKRRFLNNQKVSKENIAERQAQKTPTTPTKVIVKNLKGELDIQNAFINVADKVGGSVVTISTERTQKLEIGRPRFNLKRFGPGSPFGGEDPFEKFFEDFFGQLPEKEFKQKGLGSGFVIDKNGLILTNYHVVDGADKINVALPDGRSFAGTVKGSDTRRDLAVIKINARDLPYAELGNSDLVQVGEWVVALGNPFGHILKSPEPTVTVGVVSALHRQIPTPEGESGYLNMLQTDAAINPGNSGGPLCDLSGKVIGINVAIFSTSGGYQGLGFAIPINEAKTILGDLIEGKEIYYGWLGVSIQPITPEIAEYFNLPDQNGALISDILPDSPAEKAGLKEGDILTAIDGKGVNNLNDVMREIGAKKINQDVELDIIRDRVPKKIKAKIGKRPSRMEMTEGKVFEPTVKVEKWRGIEVADVTDEIARQLGLTNKEGVVIIEIEPSSSFYEAGLRKGDVIREINKTKIKNLTDYKKITSEARGLVLVRTDRGYFAVKENLSH
ncbi:MAG: Do family serine endopeptidase [Candidatus Omnitrophica bacterium]|nr:Do family serine endopeptidase [Candidatus Omnitrophota bacterium]